MLAREYAIRFGAAYEGGVFWLNTYGNDDTNRQEQIAKFVENMGIPIMVKEQHGDRKTARC